MKVLTTINQPMLELKGSAVSVIFRLFSFIIKSTEQHSVCQTVQYCVSWDLDVNVPLVVRESYQYNVKPGNTFLNKKCLQQCVSKVVYVVTHLTKVEIQDPFMGHF